MSLTKLYRKVGKRDVEHGCRLCTWYNYWIRMRGFYNIDTFLLYICKPCRRYNESLIRAEKYRAIPGDENT